MDNICHTLVGATIGECGARKWTPLATATLLIGANLPDVDALTYFGDHVTALGFRRGWTHGILAVMVWPFLLAGAMLAYDRFVRRRRHPDAAPARPGALLLLALLAVASHPLLDFLNTYGVRLLMPFSARWFYGDALFIVDPWVWLALLMGVVAVRVLERRGAAHPFLPARIAASLVVLYVVAMAVSGRIAAQQVAGHVSQDRLHAGVRVMVSPEPVDPFTREVLLSMPGGYAIAQWDWRRTPHLGGPWDQISSDSAGPAQRAAAASPRGRTFLSWARYPVYALGGSNGCPAADVCIGDARYPGQAWAQVALPVRPAVSSSAPVHPGDQP